MSFTWREIKSTVHAINVECRNMDFCAPLDHLITRLLQGTPQEFRTLATEYMVGVDKHF